MSGSVLQLSVKPKTAGEYGLPKRPVQSLRISPAGAEGDYNNYRTNTLKGDPDSAILVLTEEVLHQLRAEGWPVQPGDFGENVTVTGVPEASLKSGSRLQIGPARLELTRPCEPCTELSVLPYVGKEKGAAFIKTTLGRRGWYAKVLDGGVVETGAPVQVMPG